MNIHKIANAVAEGLSDWINIRYSDDSESLVEEPTGNVVDGKMEILANVRGVEVLITVEHLGGFDNDD